MPRKPSSVYIIVENPTDATTTTPGTPLTNLQAWRIPLEDGETPEQVAKRIFKQHPIGSTLVAIEDSKITAYEVDVTLKEIDDPRLPEEDEQPISPGSHVTGAR